MIKLQPKENEQKSCMLLPGIVHETLPQPSISHGLEWWCCQQPWKLCVNGRAIISFGLGITVQRRAPSFHLPVLSWIIAWKRKAIIVFEPLHYLFRSLCSSSLVWSNYIDAIGLRKTFLSKRVTQVVRCHWSRKYEGKYGKIRGWTEKTQSMMDPIDPEKMINFIH